MLDANKVYEYLSTNDTRNMLELWQQLPENTMKGTIKGLIISGNPLSTLLGFGSLLPEYCQGSNCKFGEVLGEALYRIGKELFLSGKYPDLFLMTVTGIANNYLVALINLGKFKQADFFINSEIRFWKKYIDNPELLNDTDRLSFLDNFKSILVVKIDILIHLNKIDEAWEIAFNQKWIEGNPSSDIELQRLRNKLKELKTDSGQLDKNEKQRRKKAYTDQQTSTNLILDSLKKIVGQSGIDQSLVDKMKGSEKLDPYTRSGFTQLENFLTKGESFLQKDSSEINEIKIRQDIRRASGIFVDNQPTKDQILNSLSILKKSLISARQLNNLTLINYAYYGIYLCYSRLNKSSDAADQLIALRKNLELIRKGINDPLERGGVFQVYPYLFYSSVEHMFKARRFDDMLDAIEGSKGRTITDVLEKESSQKISELNFYNIRKRLKPILAKENANYMTFHVDDDCSYICIVVKSGKIYADQVPLGKKLLNKYYNKLLQDPSLWNQQLEKINIIEKLNPFLKLFEKLVDRGEIIKGDHICYSADHILYLFPLHYLNYKKQSLIELFTVSRIHNAGHLIGLLSKSSVVPKNCLTIVVPSNEDIKNPKLNKAFKFSSTYLKRKYSGNCINLSVLNGSIKNVLSNFNNNQLIHFSTHGFFPFKDNPFNNSGLLLTDKKVLPQLYKHDPNFKYVDQGLHLLSPERLLADNCDIANSHVSLQACVAGYAREGIGGDALGIEWAFFQKGVSSLISTFWNVDISNANEFYKYFYKEWLDKKTSKALAHQKTILKLKQTNYDSDLPKEYYWAGYGLIGDWR